MPASNPSAWTEASFTLTYPEEPARVIRGRVTRPTTSRRVPFVLVLHGFKGFMDWGFFPTLARRLAAGGLAAVAFNASGSGIGEDLENFTEEGAFERDTLSRQLEDIERVRAFIEGPASNGIDVARAGLLGHSRGGGAALLHAAERGDYRAVVTWAAIESVHRWGPDVLAQWRAVGYLPVVNARTGQTLRVGVAALEDLERNADRFDIAAACRRLRAPTLVCHGQADEAVDFGAQARILDWLPAGIGRGLALPGAGHTFGAGHPMDEPTEDLAKVLEATEDWFGDHLT